jgi:hypothetical protein
MEDLKILNDILIDATYNNKVLLEVQLNKVSDKRLVIGLLTTIFSKLGELEADKQTIVETLALFVNKEEVKNEFITDCFELFNSKIKEYRSTLKSGPSLGTISKLLEVCNILKKEAVNNGGSVEVTEVPEFFELIKSCSDHDLEGIKDILVNSEMYELVATIDKIRTQI